jgi:hypothetical protein
MNFDKLKNILLDGAIVSQKSGELIQDIFSVEDKFFGIVVGGYVVKVNWNNQVTKTVRYTTLDLSEY